MTVTQPVLGNSPSGKLSCPRCNSSLPANAAFCVSCGERIDKPKIESLEPGSTQEDNDRNSRYRISSLVRRRPYVNLFFAIDNQHSRPGHQHMVALRDIDLSSLGDEARAKAVELVQREYDLLRYWQIPSVMSVIDLWYFQNHLFTAMSWKSTGPAHAQETTENSGASMQQGAETQTEIQHLYTLQDLLQSGLGLPSEQESLAWMQILCQALDTLHRRQIVIGDLDPYTIILNRNSYESQPALMVSWLLPQLRGLFPPISTVTNMSYFSAPEALLGKVEPRSDVYSLGALLYLLLTGTAPDVDLPSNIKTGATTPESEQAFRFRRRIRSLRELNGRISSYVDECVMRALSAEPAERFSSVRAMAEALIYAGGSRKGATGKSLVEEQEVFQHLSGESHTLTNTAEEQTLSTTESKDSGVSEAEEQESDTVRIAPLSHEHVQRWQSSRPLKNNVIPRRPNLGNSLTQDMEGVPTSSFGAPLSDKVVAEIQTHDETQEQIPLAEPPPETPVPGLTELEQTAPEENIDIHGSRVVESGKPGYLVEVNGDAYSFLTDEGTAPSLPAAETNTNKQRALSFSQRLKEQITGFFPALSRTAKQTAISKAVTTTGNNSISTLIPEQSSIATSEEANPSFLKQIQRTLLGEQRHFLIAAAIIETPLRVQPDQSYTIRIHIMGRDEPQSIQKPSDGMNDTFQQDRSRSRKVQAGGLSSLAQGEAVSIEVRTTLHQSYAYIVQQATVTIPARGYAAEVIIPLQPLSNGPSGRRDRLHIFFLDEMRRPLYEKPFVVEIFVSHLVQRGREGHAVLTIPL